MGTTRTLIIPGLPCDRALVLAGAPGC
jgi:hypothetical protein